LISIDCDPSPAFAQFPLDINNPWSPLTAMPTAVRNSLSLMGEAADLLLGQRVRGFISDRDARSLLEMGLKAGSYVARLMPEMLYPSWDRRNTDHTEEERHREPPVPRLFNDSVTLKQFREPEDPSRACYQALVRSRMGVNRVNKCGLLSELSLLGGDPSGGYTIRINRHTAQPIVESLGIVVGATERGTDGSEVAILKPVLPFWTDVDLFYDKGNVICSRTNFGGKNNSRWVAEPQHAGHRHSRHRHGRNDHLDVWPLDEIQNGPHRFVPDPILYNTAQGAATQAVAGPFHFPDVTVQVYPLLADQTKLDKFIEGYLNQPLAGSGYRFKTFGSYVYLLVSVCGDQSGAMWSDSNNIGCWAEREVTFCIPVKWYHRGDDGDKLITVGMIEPFVYANNGRAVTTDREVNGRPSVKATIDSPKDAWLSPTGPGEHRQLLHVEIEMFPALDLGQKARPGTLLEIDERDVLPKTDEVGWRRVSETWGPELLADLWRKTYLARSMDDKVIDATAFALEILAHGEPINRISLKQYPDAEDVEKACYQALVNTQRSVTHIYDIREILDPVHVRLYQVPLHPIARVLGLKSKSVDSTKGNVVDIIQPLRPFWMHIAVEEKLGTVLCAVNTKSPTDDINVTDSSRPGPKRSWMPVHPWITGAVGSSADTPYFCTDGFARVCRAWLDPKKGMSWDDANHRLVEREDRRAPVRLELKGAARDWLRKSLTYELAWITSELRLDSGSSQLVELTDDVDRSYKELKRSDSLSLLELMNTSSIGGYCSGVSVDSLTVLLDVIWKSQSEIYQDKIYQDMWTEGSNHEAEFGTDPLQNLVISLAEALEKLDQWLNEWDQSLKNSMKQAGSRLAKVELANVIRRQKKIHAQLQYCIKSLGGLKKECRAIERSTDLAPRLRRLLDVVSNQKGFPSIEQLAELGEGHFEATALRALDDNRKMLFDRLRDFSGYPNPISEASTIVEGIMDLVADWKNVELFRRERRWEGRRQIDALEELQLVLECILSKGWENRGKEWKKWEDQRRLGTAQPIFDTELPAQRIPVWSLIGEWAERHGLERSADPRFGESWIVPPGSFQVYEGPELP